MFNSKLIFNHLDIKLARLDLVAAASDWRNWNSSDGGLWCSSTDLDGLGLASDVFPPTSQLLLLVEEEQWSEECLHEVEQSAWFRSGGGGTAGC